MRSLISNTHDKYLIDHCLSPLGIDNMVSVNDIQSQTDRLMNLCADQRLHQDDIDENIYLYNLLMHEYFQRDTWLCDYNLSSEIKQYYSETKALLQQIPKLTRGYRNVTYQKIIRNMLIIGENITISRDLIHFNTFDITLRSINELCWRNLDVLFPNDGKEFGIDDVPILVRHTMSIGGLPQQRKEWVDDPNDKRSKIKKALTGTNLVQQDIRITIYECLSAILLYACLCTAVVTKLEATEYGRI